MSTSYDCRHLARHEIEFLRALRDAGRLEDLKVLCRQDLADQRRWDPTVDVAAVKAEAQRLLEDITCLDELHVFEAVHGGQEA